MSATLTIVTLVNKARAKYETRHQVALLELSRLRPGTPKHDKARAKAEKLHQLLYPIEAQFHDSYDGKSLMARLGLSWHHKTILKYIGPQGYMEPLHVQSLIIGLRRKELNLPTKEQMRALRITVNTQKELKAWHNFYKEKHKQLFALLERSVKMNEPLKFSV